MRDVQTIALVAVVALLSAAGAGAGRWLVAGLGSALVMLSLLVTVRSTRTGSGSGALELPDPKIIDRLTGLPNSAKLRMDLDARAQDKTAPDRIALVLFALEGFKRYNDSYGRACGDALLAWLARKLHDAVGTRGTVYRQDGGAFVVTIEAAEHVTSEVCGAAEEALSETGDGFVIWCSYGEAILPTEARTADDALKIADRRAHAYRRSPHTRDVEQGDDPRALEDPLDALRSVNPHYDVASLATAVGRRMGIAGSGLDQLDVAAQLRDVGNMAIPRAVLSHPGKLVEEEWRFVALHTLVGERLLAANFGMDDVAKLVRSSHERWDGRGYPDGLVGAETPLGSRVVFVCSAFQDMTSDRVFRAALTTEAALQELDTGANEQFDPAVVAAFREAFADAQALVSTHERPEASRPMRVLVAERDPASRFLLRRAVEAGGHECIAAEDGLQAWAIVREQSPEVVVSDWAMPRMDGDELCRRIREDPDAPYTYFVMLTALEGKEYVLRGMRAGVDDFLTKPLDRLDLEMKLIAASRVTTLHRRVKDQQQAMEAEIAVAAGVQHGLLPTSPPVIPGVLLGGLSVPAAAVGGDYYDFMETPTGQIVVVIADVAGHSISSALLMAMARTVLREQVGRGLPPHKVLEATNATMYGDLVNAGLFITLFCASYEPATGSLMFANGGHNPPLLRRADGTMEELDADGAPAGLLDDVGFELGHAHLEPGDLMVLYTDGVVETGVEHEDPFGEERLTRLVASCEGVPPDALGSLIHAAVVEHAGAASARRDDITVAGLLVTDRPLHLGAPTG